VHEHRRQTFARFRDRFQDHLIAEHAMIARRNSIG
jgi:hypothetical protein